MGVMRVPAWSKPAPVTQKYFRPAPEATNASGCIVEFVFDTVSNTPGICVAAESQLQLDQAWFWSAKWQEMEREAEDDLAAGRYEDFDTLDSFIAEVERIVKEE